MTHLTPIPAEALRRWTAALPFAFSLLIVPILWAGALLGGAWVLVAPVFTWYVFSALDAVLGQNPANADPHTPETDLFWYRAVTLVWAPLQICTLYGLLHYATRADHLSGPALVGLFFGVGVMTGTIGINFSHELMHQRNRLERGLADLLLAMVLYGHFRSEHLLVHHRHVGTPRDPVTARYNESFYQFFPRVLCACPVSAFRAEAALLARRERPWFHRANPFWRYLALQTTALAVAGVIGGPLGLALFGLQALVAIWQLELTNYVEHYGLTRRHLGAGRYEPVAPRHSWNAGQTASNWLLINLQRHSDHHCKPDRRFPLLQSHEETSAPQLPYGYPVMTMLAQVPRLWRRVMNPKVRAWRARHYPDITDWSEAEIKAEDRQAERLVREVTLGGRCPRP